MALFHTRVFKSRATLEVYMLMLYVPTRQTDRQTDRLRAKLETVGNVFLFIVQCVASYVKSFWCLKLEPHNSRSAISYS
jgi:hypothetical protein